jgi:hypothetical protein
MGRMELNLWMPIARVSHNSHESDGSSPFGAPLTRRIKIVLLRSTASHAQGLEGSRFTSWQLYRSLAGGSRE